VNTIMENMFKAQMYKNVTFVRTHVLQYKSIVESLQLYKTKSAKILYFIGDLPYSLPGMIFHVNTC